MIPKHNLEMNVIVIVGNKYDEYLYKEDRTPIVDKAWKDKVMSNQSHLAWRNAPRNEDELELADREAKTIAEEFIKQFSKQPDFKNAG
jgi:hypothetical protein